MVEPIARADPFRIGVIGCGQWGKNYVRVFHELPGARVVAACDLLDSNLQAIAERHPSIATTKDYRVLLRNPDIDAVVVATLAATHYAIAAEAIEQGKHVIVEKPLALEPAECERLTHAAAARSRILMVGHTFLYNDSIRFIKELVQREGPEHVYYLTARRNHLGKIREDVSVLWDLTAHDVSIFSYLLDQEPASVSAVGGCFLRQGREDVTFISLFYPSGAIGHIQASWVDARKIREVVLITGKRRIEFNDLDTLESVRVYEKGISIERDVESFGEFQYSLRDGEIVSPKLERREPLKSMCQHFLDCMREGRQPLTDGQSGTRVVRVLRAAADSLARRGQELPV